ncbi:MAG: large conductance mechanosensitive channel protein MscL [Pirellulaceae bacterium]|jgi:large conductance mechanosensitive channel|nr:large conductance mechanosensitive channel protein MscL [Pirellulaceae bacterium]
MVPESTSPGVLLGNSTQKALTLLDEFKKFAFKGNVVDLAVGVIIGGAFGRIIDSLVKQVIMPLISVIMPSEQGYADWKWTLRGTDIPYGQFLAEIVNFLIIALVLYIFIVKFLGWAMRARTQEAVAAPPALTKDQALLTEIRDLMKAQA